MFRPSPLRLCAALLLPVVAALHSGCPRSDPRALAIPGASAGTFQRWRMQVGDAYAPAEWREFDAMLQELRLRIMADREASGHEAIETALRGKLDGASFREVIVMGQKAKLARLTAERESARRLVNANAQRAGVLGAAGAFPEFERARAAHEKKMLALDEEIRATKARLAQFGHYEK